MAENRVIGRGSALPWRLPADTKRFKALTMGHPVIMGRKTFDTIRRPLSGRRNIVITRDRAWTTAGVEVVHNLGDALRLAAGGAEAFVAGGAEIYRLALPHATRLDLTLVHARVDGDAFFPEFSPSDWALVSDEHHVADAKHAFAFSFQRYERVK
jgi:dihydrofolate reductase